jgi:hypothetical protein
MKLLSKIMITAIACTAFAHVTTLKASSSHQNEITITNSLATTIYVSVSFATSQGGTFTTPKKQTIRSNKTVTIKQPHGKNFVKVEMYEDSQRRNLRRQRSFSLDNARFENKRNITISPINNMPELLLNNEMI